MSANLERRNRFDINGVLKSVDVREGRSTKTGSGYVTAEAIISAVIGGQENEFTVSFIANELDKNNKPNKNYSMIMNMKNYLNTRIQTIGYIEENRYWNKKAEAISSFKRLRGSFFTPTGNADSATFTLGGFIVQEAHAKTNKENKIYKYVIDVGQANYRGDSMSVFSLDVDPSRADIVHGVSSYKAKDTVVFNGNLNFLITRTEVKDENNAFGEPMVRVYTNKISNFFITGGSKPIVKEGAKYTDDVINDLIKDYKAQAVEITNKARETAVATPSVESAKEIPVGMPSAHQTSLL